MKFINGDKFKKDYQEKDKSSLNSIIMDIFDIFAKALIVIIILMTFGLRLCTVNGSSMNPTLIDRQGLIICNFFYTPKEGDIVVFHETGVLNEPVVKRVIATGDSWVRIDYNNSLLYVSDDDIFDETDIVDESEYAYFDNGHYDMRGTYEVFVPKDYIFVMGDNRNNSTDSRSELIGLVDVRTILGKVIIRFSPIEDFGFIK